MQVDAQMHSPTLERVMTVPAQMARESEAHPVKRSVRLLRVSTKAQMDTDADAVQDGNSIDSQRKATIEKERALGTINVGEYLEPGYSAQSIDKRPFFKQLMQRIHEQRDVDYVVIYMRSRVFRNYIEAAIVKQQLERLGVRIVSAREEFGDGYMGEAMEAITDVFNWLQVKMSGQDIAIKMGNKAKNGGTLGRAKLGYLNVRITVEGHKVNTVALDPERAHFVPMAFELFATGEETIASLQTKLTQAGLRTAGDARWPAGPISWEGLRSLLRDKYYAGYIMHKGVEYKGRHEPLISEDLYERVQRVFEVRSGSGTRERTHNHYLKGLFWCARCKQRFIVQRTKARNGDGEYFYFFCIGRQKGLCDQPYIPVEVLEEAVIRYYGGTFTATPAWLSLVRAGVDEALTADRGLSNDLREQYAKRLEALDRKESYLLDLAAEEDWPKDKLRKKIEVIRAERRDIQNTVEVADQRVDLSRQIMYDALALLDQPHQAYERGNERVRALLNKAFFTKLYIDGGKITEHTFKEPFDKLVGAFQDYVIYSATGGSVSRYGMDASPAAGGDVHGHGLEIDEPELVLSATCSSKPMIVGTDGLEPPTSAL